MNTIRVTNSLDPDQDQHFVGPDLDPNCLHRLLADEKKVTTGKERVKRNEFQISDVKIAVNIFGHFEMVRSCNHTFLWQAYTKVANPFTMHMSVTDSCPDSISCRE